MALSDRPAERHQQVAGLFTERVRGTRSWDAQTGGSWRYASVHDGTEYWFHGCFHEVRPDRIVQTFTFDGDPDGVALETLWFEDLGDGRTRLRTQSLCDSFEGRDAWLRSGMEVGVDEGYAKLDRMLADGAL